MSRTTHPVIEIPQHHCLHHTATHCITHCRTLQHTAARCNRNEPRTQSSRCHDTIVFTTLQHTATHSRTLQHTRTTHSIIEIQQHHCLHHIVFTTLHHTASHCITHESRTPSSRYHDTIIVTTLPHAPLPHTAMHTHRVLHHRDTTTEFPLPQCVGACPNVWLPHTRQKRRIYLYVCQQKDTQTYVVHASFPLPHCHTLRHALTHCNAHEPCTPSSRYHDTIVFATLPHTATRSHALQHKQTTHSIITTKLSVQSVPKEIRLEIMIAMEISESGMIYIGHSFNNVFEKRPSTFAFTGRRRPIGCLICAGHFPK